MKVFNHRQDVSAALPVDLELTKGHIRVDGTTEDAAISNCIRTATAEFEQFTQLAVLTQTVLVTIFAPVSTCGFRLPIGPVAGTAVPTVTIDGEAFTAFDFVGGNRPYIRWQAAFFDLTPERITIEYQAGFGTAATDVPADIAQAIMDQAALHYDGRSPMDARSLTNSPHMARIGARYRGVQA
jgi:uncharacterized phiE125 gp8 family phage protein